MCSSTSQAAEAELELRDAVLLEDGRDDVGRLHLGEDAAVPREPELPEARDEVRAHQKVTLVRVQHLDVGEDAGKDERDESHLAAIDDQPRLRSDRICQIELLADLLPPLIAEAITRLCSTNSVPDSDGELYARRSHATAGRFQCKFSSGKAIGGRCKTARRTALSRAGLSSESR